MLSKPDIIKAIRSKRLQFIPPVPQSRIDQVSIDLLLGKQFSQFKDPPPPHIGAIVLDRSLWDADELWEHKEATEFLLKPGGFVLAQTLETVCIPNNLVGLVEGRSSYGRLGLGVHVTAPKIDPGWAAPITLEMVNHGKLPILLRSGKDKPAQLMLFRLSTPLKRKDLYGSAAEDVFHHQTDPIPRSKKK